MAEDLHQADEIAFTLPFPSRFLSPNGRFHWTKKSNEAKRHRKEAWAITKAAIGANKPLWAGVKINLVYHPPNRHHYDADNLLSRSKSQIDGIADALGLDDNTFTFTFSVAEPIKGGLVKVTIGERK